VLCLTTIGVNFLVLRSEKIDSRSTPGDHLEVKVGVKLEREREREEKTVFYVILEWAWWVLPDTRPGSSIGGAAYMGMTDDKGNDGRRVVHGAARMVRPHVLARPKTITSLVAAWRVSR
jgi:hypothetical protein